MSTAQFLYLTHGVCWMSYMTLLISRLSRHLLDHLNHGVRRLLPLLVTQLDKDQLKSHSLLLQARLKVIYLYTEGYSSMYL